MTDEIKPLTKKQEIFVNEYLQCFNGAEAARRAGYSEARARQTAAELLANSDISLQIQARLNEVHMSADEALKLTADIARGGLGQFFRISDEWTFYPLPTSEILDQKEVTDDSDPEKPVKRICYRERRVILDMEKILDPQYSRLIKKFADTKNGLVIELYPADVAQDKVLKVHKKYSDAPTVNINMSWKDFISGIDTTTSDK